MRSLIMAACIMLAAPSFAQEVFRALPIDDVQNQRLDVTDERLAALERSVTSLANSVEKLAAYQNTVGKPVVQMASVQQPAAKVVYRQVEVQQQPMQSLPQQTFSNRLSQGELASIVRSRFPNGWNGEYADVSPRSGVWRHLAHHGFSSDQINGLDQNTALGLHALTHANRVSPYRSQGLQQPLQAPMVAYSQPTQRAQPQYASACANGQCARPIQQSRRSGGLLGFGILGG